MSQLRFQVGVPRAGSSARIAESENPGQKRASLAGSAARMAEAAKRLEASGQGTTMPTLRMRAQGAVIERIPADAASATSTTRTAAEVPAVSTAAPPSMSSVVTPTEENSRSGLLQTVAGRVQSFFRSLQPSDKNGTL